MRQSGNEATTSAQSMATESVTVTVDPGTALDVDLPGVAKITAPAGSFTTPGTMTVTPSANTDLPTGGELPMLTRVGPGVDVTFADTELSGPLNVSYPMVVDAPIADTDIPVIAHQNHDGTWEMVPAQISGGRMTFATSQFSPTLPTYLKPSNWVNWVSDRVTSTLIGETPTWACEKPSSSWLSSQVINKYLHACPTT